MKDKDPKKYNGPIPPPKEVLCQSAKGLEHIHKMAFVHRDIKPKNVLIWVNPYYIDQVLVKWADFPLSKPVNERGSYSMSGVRGSYDWLASEMLKLLKEDTQCETEAKLRSSVKIDVFAEGLVFGYYLLGGVHLFGSRFKIATNISKNNPVNLHSKIIFQNIMFKFKTCVNSD